MADSNLYNAEADVPERGLSLFRSIHRNLLTGEPYAGKPHVRFGGRGDRIQSILPTPIID